METVKSRGGFFEPDVRSRSFVKLSMTTGATDQMTLDDQYGMLEHFQLHAGVPEVVRSYMAAIETLWLYGWLYYPFYALVEFLSTTAVEMALRERLPKQGMDRRGLGMLLQQAKEAGLLRDEGFPSLPHVREFRAMLAQGMADATSDNYVPPPARAYVDEVIERLPKIRNSFAHARGHWIIAPGPAADALILAVEIINQLWPEPAAEGTHP